MSNLTTRQSRTSRIFLIVYVMISIATLYHSAFGFGTIDGLPDKLEGFELFKWWFLGLLCATSVDVGMGAITFSMVLGYRSKFLTLSLIILATFSAYSQLVYSAYFAEDMSAITKNQDLRGFMQFLLDIRIIILPLCLPFFSLFYGFSAKDSTVIIEEEIEVTREKREIIHFNQGEEKSSCGIDLVSKVVKYTEDKGEVTCKNCLRQMK